MMHYKFFLRFLVVCLLDHSEANRSIRDKIYTTLSGASPCILRTNGTHAFGCTSNFGGNDGTIFMVNNNEDMRWLSSNNGKSYMIVLNQTMFKRDILQELNTMEHVNGVLYMQTKKGIYEFSPDSQCPNEYSGLSAPPKNIQTCNKTSHGWNPPGNSLLFSSFRFPIFIVTDPKEISQVENCFRKYNIPITGALCSMRMKSHMFAATDTRLCLRRSMSHFNINPVRYCDPLGDKNIYVPLYPLHLMEPVANRSITIVGTRLDSTSMFYGLSPGSVSTATSVVTLLSTARLLFKWLPYNVTQKYDKNVLFVFFQGEAYDYIGSSRIVYDMSQGQFPYKERPISKEQIDLFIDISQIMAKQNIVFHYKEKASTSPTLLNFMKIFEKKCATYHIRPRRISNEFLPPTSMQSFLTVDEDLPAFVVSSYDDTFENKFFHSTQDDAENAQYQYSNGSSIAEDSLQALIANLSISLASSIYQHIVGEQPEIDKNITYKEVDELLHCYLDTFKCNLLRSIDERIWNSLVPSPMDYYVGVSMIANSLTSITALALSFLTGVPDPTNPCTNEENYSPFRYILIKGKNETCYRTTVNATDATSPAFVIEGYDFASGLYSSWTESVWRDVEVEIYLTYSTPYAAVLIITATIITLFSFFAVYWFNKNSRRLFGDD